MRKFLVFSFAAVQMGLMTASAATMTGWISDSSCGASNANGTPESRECAARCIKSGSEAVFVNDSDQKVYKIAGTTKAADHLNHKVQIEGEVKGDTLTVKNIRQAK